MSVSIHRGSILDSKADFIVNPANCWLRHGAGLAKVIADAAAPYASRYEAMTDQAGWDTCAAWRREQSRHPLIATGGAGLTSAGALPYKGIIHAVGPVWGGGALYEPMLLQQAHHSALGIAERQGGKSIAFPAISCGLFGYPVEEAAPVAVLAGRMTDLAVEFWLFDVTTFEAYAAALAVIEEGPSDG